MTHECRIYDHTGKLKKVVLPKEIEEQADKKIFTQKSTRRAQTTISKFKNQKQEPQRSRFYTNLCVCCGSEFHPRHRSTKYCSHECQKRFYYERRKEAPMKNEHHG